MPKKRGRKGTSPLDTDAAAIHLADFFRRLDSVHQSISNGGQDQAWFRGHGDGSWSLKPRLYRDDHIELREYEDDFRSEFEQLAWPYLEGSARVPATQWEWYFLMQHYGMPTRLLDWSESALIALYFALKDARGKPATAPDPAVWVLNPFALNQHVGRVGDAILDQTHRKTRPYLPYPFSRKRLPRRPIALSPPHKTLRIASQQGKFTVHGALHDGLESYDALRRHCAKISIARSALGRMMEELRVAGIGETTVFPELDGLARELVDYYRWEQPTKKKRQT